MDEFCALILSGTAIQDFIENLGILRLLRLARVLRLIRMVRLIPELKSMVYLISASMWSFIWTMVLIVLLVYCTAIFYTDTANRMAAKMDNGAGAGKIKKYWGSVGVSMLTLFEAITGGNDWCVFIDAFEGDEALLIILSFSLYVAFAMLVMLNLVTGVFVEGAQRIVKQDTDNELLRTVCKIFGSIDGNEDMAISKDEFMEHLNNGALDLYFQAVDLSREQGEGLFTLLDVDASGALSVEEFVRGCIRLRGPARAVDLAAMAHDFEEKLTFARGLTENLQDETSKLQTLMRSMLQRM